MRHCQHVHLAGLVRMSLYSVTEGLPRIIGWQQTKLAQRASQVNHISKINKTAMDRRPEHSEEKLKPTLSIGRGKQPAASSAWTPNRRGDGVYRLKNLNQSRKKKRRGIQFEEQDDGKRQGPRTFLILGVLSLIVLVIASYWFFTKRASMRAASANQGIPASRVLEVSEAEVVKASAKDWKGALPMEAAEGFIRAATVEERFKWVRDPARVEPLVRAFFCDGPGAQETVAALVPVGAVQRGDLHYERFRADLGGGRSRLVCVVLTDDGGKVDFESYVRHGSVPWDDLLSGRVVAADEVRLFVSAGDYYNFDFSDDGQWRSFVARTPDLGEDLHVYARRGSPAEATLNELTASGPAPVTLAVRSVDRSHERRLFEVTRVLAPAWVVEQTAIGQGR